MSNFMPPMLYRVFLQDEKDAPGPAKNPLNIFRIRSGERPAWMLTTKNAQITKYYTPSVEYQLKAMSADSRIQPSSELIDGHWPISCNCHCPPLAICHTQDEIPKRVYEIARIHAQELAESLSREKGKPYIFIDLTSRGDKDLAKKLSKIVYEVNS